MNAGQQPLLVLSEDVMRQQGKDAQSNNIDACKKISNAVRTTLGPKGMDKMLVDSIGDITVTNDGVTILDEMEIEHPAAKMMVEVAKTQDEEVGDGTTSAVVLGGELLKKADDLIDQEVHPTIIASGYRQAKERTLEILDDIAEDITFEDEETLQSVANTAMTGKSAETAKKKLAKIAVDAVKQVAVEQENGYNIDHDMIQVEKKTGSSTEQTKLIQGVIVDKEKAHSGMDNKTEDAQIALLDSAIEVQETETSAEIHIDDPNKLQDFIEQEEESLREMVDQVKDAGANVVFCQKGIDDIAQHFFAKEGIFAVRRVKKSDMEKLAKATDANIVTTLTDLEENDLGQAGRVQQRRVAGDSMVFVEECDNAKAVSVLLRGGTDHVVDELERAMEDAIGGVTSALRVGKVVGGGGAAEIELGQELREYADSVGGREQLAINAFAEAVEAVPRTLAENAGLDPIDVLVDLRSQHDKGEQWAGIDVFTGKSEDLFNRGVVEPLQIKTQALQSAAEAAELILRIDDVMASEGGLEADGGGPGGGGPPGGGGMPGGMGGMGGMM